MKIMTFCCTIAILVIGTVAFGNVEYNLTIIPPLPGSPQSYSEARAINNLGVVAGLGFTSDNQERAFTWNNGSVTIVQGVTTSAFSSSLAINSTSQLVGVGGGSGYIATNGVPTPISNNLGPGPFEPKGINDQALVVGDASVFGNSHPASWSAQSGAVDLNPLLPNSSAGLAWSVNNSGQIVGSLTDATNGTPRGFLLNGSVATFIGGLPGRNASEARAINSIGQVAGGSYSFDTVHQTNGDDGHSYIWSSGSITDLGSIPGEQDLGIAFALNDSGQVVGQSEFNDVFKAYVWDSLNGMRDLNSLITPGSGYHLNQAMGINNGGQIVGNATDSLGHNRGFLLTPVAVPEPSSIILAVMGTIGFLLIRRSRISSVRS